MQEESLQAIRLIHSSMLAQKISVADFVIPEKLLSSCNHANKKLKEAEKMSDLASMKAKLIESNTLKERAQKIEKKDIPAQVMEIEEIEQKKANI